MPWAGYFNLISQVDIFVFLDDVQFARRSWQSRNRILLNGKEKLLSVPIRNTGRATLIKDTIIDNTLNWQRKHWFTLHSAYNRAPYGGEAFELLAPFFIETTTELLSDLNQGIIQGISAALGLNPAFIRASDLRCGGKRSWHLTEILHRLNCDEYISPRGSARYLEEDNFERLSGVHVRFQEFQPTYYPQIGTSEFVSHLSIVDVIANIGIKGTRDYICASNQEH